MTGTPADRHVAASSATLATTFCALAWSGAPESANAPPSMITSFCMSWMISAVRLVSSARPSSVTASPHVGESVAGHRAGDPVQGGAGRDEELVPARSAPVQVPDVLRD